MITPHTWMADALAALQNTFGPRLRYLGLQGSYRRGEATEASDIDLVVLLDAVALTDLDAYRAIVRALPEGEKACGFFCGVEEFAQWPRHELFQLQQDTVDHFGKLADFLPPIAPGDIHAGVQIGAATLLHLLTHSYIYAAEENRATILKDAYKMAFFILQSVHYLKTGIYCASKKELFAQSGGVEKEIISAGMNFSAWLSAHTTPYAFDLLLTWCRNTLLHRV